MIEVRHLLLQVTEHLTQIGLVIRKYITLQNLSVEAEQSSHVADLEAQQSGPHCDFHDP